MKNIVPVVKKKILSRGLARSIMREILKSEGIKYPQEVDRICKMIPQNASISRICGNVFINKLPEGGELAGIVKKYNKSFELGRQMEYIFDFYGDGFKKELIEKVEKEAILSLEEVYGFLQKYREPDIINAFRERFKSRLLI